MNTSTKNRAHTLRECVYQKPYTHKPFARVHLLKTVYTHKHFARLHPTKNCTHEHLTQIRLLKTMYISYTITMQHAWPTSAYTHERFQRIL